MRWVPRTMSPVDVALPGTDLLVEVEYDYEPYEPEVRYPPDQAYPGADPQVSATAVIVREGRLGAQHDILECLNEETVKSIEERVLDELSREPDYD